MSNKLKDWSTTAADNNATPPEGWPEGMAPSKVNDTARQNMKYLREWYEDSQWIRYDHTISASTSTTVTISGDVTDVYVTDRAVRLDQDGTKTGRVTSASYTAPNTTVTIAGVTISSPTIIEVGAVAGPESLPYSVTGPDARSSIGYPAGYIDGLDLSIGADADHDITISTGVCRAEGDGANIDVSSALTKQLDAAWAAGDNAGGLPTGVTLTANTWLYVFVIADDDGNVDAGFDDNASATNLLADSGYTHYRHVGSAFINALLNFFTNSIINNKDIGKGLTVMVFPDSISLPSPPLVDYYRNILVVGGGGAGAAAASGGNGGTTNFNSIYYATGGFGALGGGASGTAGTGGTGYMATPSEATLLTWVSDGVQPTDITDGQTGYDGIDGSVVGWGGAAGWIQLQSGYLEHAGDAVYGNGGNGANTNFAGGGGGGALFVPQHPATSTVTLTIGAGGTNANAPDGGDGFIRLEI